MLRPHWIAVALLAVTATASDGQPAGAIGRAVAPVCNRARMTALVDRYLTTLVAHDASGLPLGGSSSNLQAAEIFRIDRGRITGMDAIGVQLP